MLKAQAYTSSSSTNCVHDFILPLKLNQHPVSEVRVGISGEDDEVGR